MDRDIMTVGFLGMDKYEYIMYISRVLYHLGKKVLVVDCSETSALTACIPESQFKQEGHCDYRGIGYLDNRDSRIPSGLGRDCDLHSEDHDCILIDFGCLSDSGGLGYLDCLVYVTDQQEHNIERICSLRLEKPMEILIIKDMVGNRIPSTYITRQFGNIPKGKVFMAYQDDVDAACRINCQHDAEFKFTRLSRQTKKIVKGLVSGIYPEISPKEINKAYRKAEKGE